MKKRMILISIVIAVICCSSFLLSACSFFSELGGGTLGKTPATPKLSTMGGIIMWDADPKATAYEIYENDVYVTMVYDTYYVCRDLAENTQVHVVAVNEENDKTSDASAKVLVYKQTGFSESESMNITLETGAYTIPARINHVYVSGSSEGAYIVIENRTTDLIITLDNVSMTTPNGKSCIGTADGTYDSNAKRYCVTLNVLGNNDLRAGDVTSVPEQPESNSDKDGGEGYVGGNALNLANIAVIGSGSLTLTGGKGGKGGKGANSESGLHSPGDGGDGGVGGNAIATSKIVICMNTTGCVQTYAGEGGAGGSYGVNGSVATGIWNQILGTLENGKDGKAGACLVGDIVVLNGVYID